MSFPYLWDCRTLHLNSLITSSESTSTSSAAEDQLPKHWRNCAWKGVEDKAGSSPKLSLYTLDQLLFPHISLILDLRFIVAMTALPKAIEGGCLCGGIRYKIDFADDHDWKTAVSTYVHLMLRHSSHIFHSHIHVNAHNAARTVAH